MEAKDTKDPTENLSEIIRFRVKPQVKVMIQSQAAALNLTMSEYLNEIVQGYDGLKQTVASLKAQADPADPKATSKGAQPQLLTPERVAKIRQLAIKDYQEQHLDKNGGKTPYIELNKQLNERLANYETKDLKALFERTKGQKAVLRDAQGNVVEEIKIVDLPDLVKALLESYKIKPVNAKG